VRNRPSAIERSTARRAGWMRLTRTIALGTIATVAALFWVADQYGIEREVMMEFVATSVLFVGLLIAAGLCATVVLWAVKHFSNRK